MINNLGIFSGEKYFIEISTKCHVLTNLKIVFFLQNGFTEFFYRKPHRTLLVIFCEVAPFLRDFVFFIYHRRKSAEIVRTYLKFV